MKLKELKQKIKTNAKKILIVSSITATGVYVILNEIRKKDLSDKLDEANEDINLLMDVMDGTVLDGQRNSELRQLRYAEGRLSNGLKDGTISEIDAKIRREEIDFHSSNIVKIDKAKERINS